MIYFKFSNPILVYFTVGTKSKVEGSITNKTNKIPNTQHVHTNSLCVCGLFAP